MSASAEKKAPSTPIYVALTGNPNSGKTTLFNALTGLRAKVGNYAGVTVERKEGPLRHLPEGMAITILDLPGTYSLSPKSLDEQVSRDILYHRLADVPAPKVVVVVVDASNLERNLYYATQVIELGYPTVLALNMMDVAEENGHEVNAGELAKELGIPVVPLVASTGFGLQILRDKIVTAVNSGKAPALGRFYELPAAFQKEVSEVGKQLAAAFPQRQTDAESEALLVIGDEVILSTNGAHYPQAVHGLVAEARRRLEAAEIDWRSVAIESRYARIHEIHDTVVTESGVMKESFSDKVDRVLTHKVWGMLIFVAIMALLFQCIFAIAKYPMDWIEAALGFFGEWVGSKIPAGDLNALIVTGIIGGVGSVVVFLPQIILLFLFISILEDTGYMARAAFLMDRLMSKVGLHGKSFIPMLSSFACAIPGIMATRTIESPKDRLVTILVAPLMSCSARLPVYTLLIAAAIPNRRVLGIFSLAGLVMLSMYLLGIVVALIMAWLFKKTLLKGATPMLIMELPPYKRPVLSVTLRHMWDRSKLFLQRAGTVILGISIILWFLATYPKNKAAEAQAESERVKIAAVIFPQVQGEAELAKKAGELAEYKLVQPEGTNAPVTPPKLEPKDPAAGGTNAIVLSGPQAAAFEELDKVDKREAGEKLRHSFAGRLGHMMEPLIAPLGFDWKMGIGIVASFAAREVFVTTMSVVYNLGENDDSDEANKALADTLKEQQREDGSPVYTTLTAVTLMVFYVFALQCVSTVAVVRRETNSWKWPIFQWVYMAALAWGLAFLTYWGGHLLGFK